MTPEGEARPGDEGTSEVAGTAGPAAGLDLHDPKARRLLALALLRPLATATLLVLGYALVPGTSRSTWISLLVFAVAITGLAVLIVLQVRSIVRARYPALRAVEVVATVLPLFLLLFAITYLGISQRNTSAFSLRLDHVRALYFSIVVFATVGFGDIVPKTDAARIVVTVQIVLDLLVIGVVARLVVGAVQRGRARSGSG